MPKINQALLDRLADELGVTKSQVYARIQHVHNQTFLERHIAALKLAADEGINIHKYSTPEERNQLRGAVNTRNGAAQPASTMVSADEPCRRQARYESQEAVEDPEGEGQYRICRTWAQRTTAKVYV